MERIARYIEESVQSGDFVLFHAMHHNPSCVDPEPAQWQRLLMLIHKKKARILFDCAFIGLARCLDEDFWAVRAAAELGVEMIVVCSFSKCMGLYVAIHKHRNV